MNPFELKSAPVEKSFMTWKQMFPKPYDKETVDPYTKTRIILANGAEFEANWFSHQFARHTPNMELKRELALVREIEKEQQLKTSLLKPGNESQLEHTIGYEQLAVDLTAFLAQRETDCNVKKALDFALLEDFDHLYRYADLLDMNEGIKAEKLVGGYTEIMPGRPTVAHHRFPKDNVRYSLCSKKASVQTNLAAMIITAAEQQTMNYYMNVTTLAKTDLARKLYQEIALVEEEHVTHYESLLDPNATWLENLLWHEYSECYVYWSNYMTETDERIKEYWEQNLMTEAAHLHKAVELLQTYEKKDACDVIPDARFPEPIVLSQNIEYVRSILGNTVQFTSFYEGYENINNAPANNSFFYFQGIRNKNVDTAPSHIVIEKYIEKNGKDYRYETAPNPVKELQDRDEDNTSVGRIKDAASSTSFECN